MLPRSIIAIGASSFFGRVDPEGGGFIGRLKTWHESNHRKNRVYNLGISSETSTDLLKRLTSECTPRKPDLIILGASSNDARRTGSKEAPCETPIGQYAENLLELIGQAMSFCPVLVMIGHPIDEKRTNPVQGTSKYFSRDDLEIYFDVARKICSENNVLCLDIYTEFINDEFMQGLWEDGLHPNAFGHRKIFESLKDYLIAHFDVK
ncbi:MAG: GDSL-type esterase/lipase family protein [Candidatus Peribacteraceae bacterium]|nr:GDSL-type esterase/lipase family protein [Candidatus Peribacteraceae bacterium]